MPQQVLLFLLAQLAVIPQFREGLLFDRVPAGDRATNAVKYLGEKGIDPSRVTTRSGAGQAGDKDNKTLSARLPISQCWPHRQAKR